MCHPAIENKTNVLWDKLQQLSCSPDAVDCRVLNREWRQTQGACCWHTDAGENVVMGLKAVNVTTSPTVACNANAMMPNAHNHVSNNPSQVVVMKPALIIMTTGSLTCDGPGDDSEESRSHRLVPELHPSLGWTSGPPGSKDIKSTIEENTCYKKSTFIVSNVCQCTRHIELEMFDFNVSTIARLAIVDTLFFGKSLALALN